MTTDQIIDALGIKESSDEFKSKIVTKIMAAADLRFARLVDDIMDDGDREVFLAETKGQGPEVIAAWVSNRYEGIGEAYTAILQSIVTGLKNKGLTTDEI